MIDVPEKRPTYACPLCRGALDYVEGPEKCRGEDHPHLSCPHCNHVGWSLCVRRPEHLERHKPTS